MNHRLDTDTQVLFYENDFYPLSSFSAFQVVIWDHTFPTAEHAYHWRKFMHLSNETNGQSYILYAPSAHQAFKLAKSFERAGLLPPTWKDERVDVMRLIIRAKAKQHDYVRQKLLATGDRELIEDSWRDDFWGWGENHDGANTLGKLWMELREELRVARAGGSTRGRGQPTPERGDAMTPCQEPHDEVPK